MTRANLAIGGLALITVSVVSIATLSLQRTLVGRAKANACQGHMTELAIGIHKYHEKYGRLPPASLQGADGNSAHSWRVLILEFVEPELFKSYNMKEPWNGPSNRQLESRMPRCFACPSVGSMKKPWNTNYFVITGPDTAFPIAGKVSFEDICTERNNTIMLIESITIAAHWMEPKDADLSTMSFDLNDESKPSISSLHKTGPSVCMIDGTKRRLESISPRILRQMAVIRPIRD